MTLADSVAIVLLIEGWVKRVATGRRVAVPLNIAGPSSMAIITSKVDNKIKATEDEADR